jgi:hypothetical protein
MLPQTYQTTDSNGTVYSAQQQQEIYKQLILQSLGFKLLIAGIGFQFLLCAIALINIYRTRSPVVEPVTAPSTNYPAAPELPNPCPV